MLSARRFLAARAPFVLALSAYADYNEQQKQILPSVTAEDVRKHTSQDKGLWVALNGEVYDLTHFHHPGGKRIIEKYAGTDASAAFNSSHGPDWPAKYNAQLLGPLEGDLEEGPELLEQSPAAADNVVARDVNDPAYGGGHHRRATRDQLPPVSEIICASDFEYLARAILPDLAWNYYSGGTEDEISLRENHNAYNRVFFKPRMMRDVANASLETTMLGSPVAAPFYCSAAAMAKLGHPDGECSIARACGKAKIMQMICHQASLPFDQIHQQIKSQPQWAQIIPLNMQHSISGIKQATNAGVPAIFITVDVPVIGKRDKDNRTRSLVLGSFDSDDGDEESGEEPDDGGLAAAGIVFDETAQVTWDDFSKLQETTPVPLMIKGLQSAEDVVMAAEMGVKAVVLSNHGGRQLDFSRAPLEILVDVIPELRRRGLECEVYIDGGVSRGSDILKAVALGARGVGLGRMFLYANACYGQAGVTRLIEILEEEMLRDMKMLGVTRIDQLGPQYVDARALHMRSSPPVDYAWQRNYEAFLPPRLALETKE